MNPPQTDKNLKAFIRDFGQSNGVFYLGHASILCVLNGRKIAFDPVLLSQPYQGSWTFFPDQTRDLSLMDVDAVIISHIHQDHYDREYLKAISKKAKIAVVGGRQSFENDLKNNGIDFVALQPDYVEELFDGIFVKGTLHESNGIDSSAVIFNEQIGVYHGNDNYCTDASLLKLAQAPKRIDLACIPYAYINWYPFLLDQANDEAFNKDAEANRLIKMYMDYCVNATKLLNAKITIPFGANLVLDDGNGYSPINMAVKTPFEFKDYVEKEFPGIAPRISASVAGDYFGLVGNELKPFQNSNFSSRTYREAMAIHLKEHPNAMEAVPWRDVDKSDFVQQLNVKVKSGNFLSDEMIRFELNGPKEKLKLQINLVESTAQWVDSFSPSAQYHHLVLDEVASNAWLNGCRFEEIIGMRRFRLTREPNIYAPTIMRFLSTVL